MSRAENYYHPVVDILDTETKQLMIDHFHKHEKSHSDHTDADLQGSEFYNYYRTLGYADAKVDEDLFKRNIELLMHKSVGWNFRRQLVCSFIETNDFSVPRHVLEKVIDDAMVAYAKTQGADGELGKALFHKSASNPPMFNGADSDFLRQLQEMYEADDIGFLKTEGAGKTLTRHRDPGRTCSLTIPLYPDYSQYRHCRFYESFDEVNEPHPIHTVEYDKIRNPVLLNVKKVHEIGDNKYDGPSLCFQFEFQKTDYKQTRKLLSQKGLLTTV